MSTLLLVGGPMDLDGKEIPDDGCASVFAVEDDLGTKHIYYLMRDFVADRWVARHENMGTYPQ